MNRRVEKRTNWKWLLICLAIPVGIGLLSALVSMDGMKRFETVAKPPLTPPEWLFPVAWTVLYLLMGYASYVVWRSDAPVHQIDHALVWYGAQLAANFLWSPLFFQWNRHLAALMWLVLIVFLIVVTMVRFWRVDRKAGLLIVPYLCWTLFAGYLNAGVWLLNR
ncbi:MAG: tryptophan-rich sensory protein [Clostridia bacterium]|nr:tryptophan-rich sensory protein [Clostridia bacterium]MBP3650201.1 tryptophan-rich sensory protein [Clostridia bacterium]